MTSNSTFSDSLDEIQAGLQLFEQDDSWEASVTSTLEEYSIALNRVIEWLNRQQKRRNNDERRDRALDLMKRIQRLSGDLATARIWFSEKSMAFLLDYKFDDVRTLEDSLRYIESQNQWINWNSTKFNKFILHISWFQWHYVKKAEIMLKLLNESTLKCSWEKESYLILAQIVRWIKWSQKIELKVAFNRLPQIQKDRKKGNGNDNSDPWNTLYYESMWHGWEAKWYPGDALSKLPQRLWPLAAHWSQK